jgi:hypothetical protein
MPYKLLKLIISPSNKHIQGIRYKTAHHDGGLGFITSNATGIFIISIYAIDIKRQIQNPYKLSAAVFTNIIGVES